MSDGVPSSVLQHMKKSSQSVESKRHVDASHSSNARNVLKALLGNSGWACFDNPERPE